jgi:GNAT superfamily N-acetyltransferase
VALQHLVFRPDEPEALLRYRSYVRDDPTFRIGQTRVAEMGGRIVGHLRVWDRKLAVRGTVLTAGGIGSLLTHPEYRGRGIASGLLENTEQYFEEASYDIGLLFSIIGTPYYACRGWSPIPISTFEISLADAAESGTFSPRELEPDKDMQAVRRLHDAVSGRYTGTEVRDQAYWLTGPARYRSVFPRYGVERGGELCGYVNWDIVNGKVWVAECCAGSEDAYADLAALVVREGIANGPDPVIGSLPQNHPLIKELEALAGASADWSSHNEMMVKIARWDRFSQKLGLDGRGIDLTKDQDVVNSFWRALFGCGEDGANWDRRLGTCPPAFYWWTDIF